VAPKFLTMASHQIMAQNFSIYNNRWLLNKKVLWHLKTKVVQFEKTGGCQITALSSVVAIVLRQLNFQL